MLHGRQTAAAAAGDHQSTPPTALWPAALPCILSTCHVHHMLQVLPLPSRWGFHQPPCQPMLLPFSGSTAQASHVDESPRPNNSCWLLQLPRLSGPHHCWLPPAWHMHAGRKLPRLPLPPAAVSQPRRTGGARAKSGCVLGVWSTERRGGWGKGGSGKQLRTPPDDVIRQLRCSPVVLGPDTLAALELVRRWKGRKARRPTASMAAVPALTAT
jgi:hypothetical protein